MERDEERRLSKAAAELRQRRIEPERDLWPDIDAAIERDREIRRSRRRWRFVPAVAAVLLLALAAGWFGGGFGPDAVTSGPDPMRVVRGADGGGDIGRDLATIHDALTDLSAALAVDPDDANLNRLLRMVQGRRSDVMQRHAWSRALAN